MLTLNEKKNYVLSHKKDFQKFEKLSNDEWNKFFKKYDDEANAIKRKEYKLLKRDNPKAKIKLKLVKTKPFKPEKVDDKYLKKVYMRKNVGHKEKVCDIDLHPYLETLRRKNKEFELILLIKNKKVIKKYLYTSNKYCSVNTYKFINNCIPEAKRKKADIYMVHNHPLVISAIPSIQDVRSCLNLIENLKKKGVKLADFGVVTFDDYYSYRQQRRITNKALKLAKKDKIKNNWVLELLETTFLARDMYVLKRKKKSHPNFIYSYKKADEIKKLKNSEYKKIQRAARKEVQKIIKEYPEYAI